MRRTIAVLTLVAAFLGVFTAGAAAAEDKPTPQEWGVSNFGATVASDNGQISLQVPPGTFTGKARYTPMSTGDFPTPPANSIWAGDPFRLQFIIDGDEGNNGSPSTLVITYNPANLGGRSESTVQLVKQAGDNTQWTVLPATLNTANHTVTAQVTDSGYYGISVSNVFATAAPAPSAAPAPTAVPPAAPTPAPAPTAAPAPTPVPAPVAPPSFKLGFATLASIIPDIAGQPLENEHYGPNGDSLQQTTKGLMVWRKADNWTAFTNGSRTWVNGPYGVMERGNDERFDWER